MKHVKTLSSVKPMQAQEPAWWTLGNFFKLGPFGLLAGPAAFIGFANDSLGWLGQLINDLLQG